MDFKIDLAQLKRDIEHHAKRYKLNQRRDKKFATFFAVFSAASAATITALLGLAQFWPASDDNFQIAAIILAALQATISAYGGLFKSDRLWVLAASSRSLMLDLLKDISHAETTDTLTDELLFRFYTKYKEILERENSIWQKMRTAA